MRTIRDRRRFLAGLAAGAAGFVGAPFVLRDQAFADEAPETTTLRLRAGVVPCSAPYYIVEELLRAEGFTDIKYLPSANANLQQSLSQNEIDLAFTYAAPALTAIDSGAPITVLAGEHSGCNAVFAHEGIRSIRDLKGRKVSAQPFPQVLAVMAAYVGLDPAKDIEWVSDPSVAPMQQFIDRKVDAFLALPPVPQELRARKIGHEIVNITLDRPWSQYFCCMLTGNRDFVRRHPIATKRALRAFLKATDFCIADPAAAARIVVERGFARNYDYLLQTLTEVSYKAWRDYNPEDTLRFYGLRLHEAGYIKFLPQKLIAEGSDWRFLEELKRELKA